MRLIFAGTPAFAAVSLRALAADHDIALVLTQPERPAGRGLKPRPSAVKSEATTLGLEVAEPGDLRAPALLDTLRGIAPDGIVVAAYGLILPPALLGLGPLGAVNVHASLLPRWRGAAPIQRAIMAGDAVTGITIMQMDSGLDTGPVLAQESLAISPDDTSGSLHDRLAALGARLIARVLAPGALSSLQAHAQDASGATYAAKLTQDEKWADFRLDASTLSRRSRALDPRPGLVASWDGSPLKLYRADAERASTSEAPGAVIDAGETLRVACGGGTVLAVRELQRPGGRRLPAAEALRGWPELRTARFEPDPPPAKGGRARA